MTPPPAQPYSDEEVPTVIGQLKKDVSRLVLSDDDDPVEVSREFAIALFNRLAASLEELQRLREALREREQDTQRLREAVEQVKWGMAKVRFPIRGWSDEPDDSYYWRVEATDMTALLNAARGVSSGDQKGAEE